MSKGNPFQDQINAAGFDQRLMQNDSDTWGVLLEYVREQVKARQVWVPPGMDRQEAVEDYTSRACTHIVYKLKGFQKRGLLSAYIDKLIRTAVSNQEVKRLMEATSRFLMATDQLPGPYQRALREIVRGRPSGECALLLACMDGQPLDWSDWRRQRLWRDARHGLLYDQDFDYLLHTLARDKHCQANTLLDCRKALGESEQSLSASVEDEEETVLEKLPDPASTPEEEVLRGEASQKLLECLEKLRHRSGHHYQAIVRRFDYDESSEQIALALAASQAATVRQWIQRGLASLRLCLGEDQINGGSDERYDL
jgi:DNA-directed RNA polymerase specialized sigma24 family protein